MGSEPGPQRSRPKNPTVDRLARQAEIGFALAVTLALFTGFFILGGTVRTPGYFPVLQAHVVIGIGALVLTLPGLLGHFVRHPDRRAQGVMLVGAVLLGAAGVLLEEIPTPSDVGVGEVAAILLLMGIGSITVLAVGWRALGRGLDGAHITGSILVFLITGSLTSGWAAHFARGDSRVPAEQAHTLLALGVFFGLVPHLKLVRRWIRGSERRGLLAAGLIGFVALGAFGVELVSKVLAPTTIPSILERTPVLVTPQTQEARAKPPAMTFDPVHIGASRSCGDAGCHPALTAQWRGSAHRFAADNRLYRMSVAELVKERGPDEAVFCANCHDPERVLAGTVQRDYADGDPPPSDGVSCIACHSSLPWDSKQAVNGHYRYRQPVLYPGDTDEERNRNIRLDPRAHRAGFNVRGHSQSESGCTGCHAVALSPDMGAGITAHVQVADPVPNSEVDCNHCHMPNTTPAPRGRWDLGFESPAQYNHHLVGMNMDLPLYATHVGDDGPFLEEVAETARGFVAGELLPFEEGDVELAETEYGQALLTALAGSVLVVEVDAAGQPDGIDVRVKSTNVRGGHSFPIGPFDLQEVWLEVVVRDADGREWGRVGGLDERGWVDADARRLGGVERDRSGQELLRHRIWDVDAIEDVRQVSARRSVRDRLFVPLPPDAPRKLEVSARWCMRRLSPRVADDAFGEGELRFPVHVIGQGSARAALPAAMPEPTVPLE